MGKKDKLLYVNAAFAKMMRLEQASTMAGKSWRDIYDEKDMALLEEHIRDSLEQAGKW